MHTRHPSLLMICSSQRWASEAWNVGLCWVLPSYEGISCTYIYSLSQLLTVRKSIHHFCIFWWGPDAWYLFLDSCRLGGSSQGLYFHQYTHADTLEVCIYIYIYIEPIYYFPPSWDIQTRHRKAGPSNNDSISELGISKIDAWACIHRLCLKIGMYEYAENIYINTFLHSYTYLSFPSPWSKTNPKPTPYNLPVFFFKNPTKLQPNKHPKVDPLTPRVVVALEASEAGTPSLVEELAGSPEGKDEHDISESPVLHLYLKQRWGLVWLGGWVGFFLGGLEIFGGCESWRGFYIKHLFKAETREAEIEEFFLECLKVWFWVWVALHSESATTTRDFWGWICVEIDIVYNLLSVRFTNLHPHTSNFPDAAWWVFMWGYRKSLLLKQRRSRKTWVVWLLIGCCIKWGRSGHNMKQGSDGMVKP